MRNKIAMGLLTATILTAYIAALMLSNQAFAQRPHGGNAINVIDAVPHSQNLYEQSHDIITIGSGETTIIDAGIGSTTVNNGHGGGLVYEAENHNCVHLHC